MTQQVVLSEECEVVLPSLHDAKVRGFLLCSDERLFVPLETTDSARRCLVLHGVERLRADDFRQGNIVLDVTVASASDIDLEDVAYAYGVEPLSSPFLLKTMERLSHEGALVVKINPSYGCVAVCICRRFEIEDDALPQ